MIRFSPAEYATRSVILFLSGYVCGLSAYAPGGWWAAGAVAAGVVGLGAWGTAKMERAR